MKIVRKELHYQFHTKNGIRNITNEVEALVEKYRIKDGMLYLHTLDNKTSLLLSEEEENLLLDYEMIIKTVVPEKPHSRYLHNGYQNNADAYLKRMLCGSTIVLSITEYNIDLATFEQIMYLDFEGGKDKAILLKLIGVS